MREFSWRQFSEPRAQSHTSWWARCSREVRLTGGNAQVETSLGYMGLHSLAIPGGGPSAPKEGSTASHTVEAEPLDQGRGQLIHY